MTPPYTVHNVYLPSTESQAIVGAVTLFPPHTTPHLEVPHQEDQHLEVPTKKISTSLNIDD